MLLEVRTTCRLASLDFDPVPELVERLRGIAKFGFQVLSDSDPVADLASGIDFFLTTLQSRVVRQRQPWVLGLLARWEAGGP